MKPAAAGSSPVPPVASRALGDAVRRLHAYRPRFRDARFWVVQAIVLAIAGGHLALETLAHQGSPLLVGEAQTELLSFLPVALFLIPVVIAALGFGLGGAAATAAWCTALTIPTIVLHEAAVERAREAMQLGLVDIVAVFVGQRVDRERAARGRAEAATVALQGSEAKYRSLFESSAIPVLVLDSPGRVLEANKAASELFGQSPDQLRGALFGSLLGGASVGAGPRNGADRDGRQMLHLRRPDGTTVQLAPLFREIAAAGDGPTLQVLLRDVTEEQSRQAGLRAYAASILRAQEEERRRIAQELHDDTIQTLVLICRRLDAAEGHYGLLPLQAGRDLSSAREEAEKVVGGLRDFARGLRPPALDDLGLTASIRRLVADVSDRAGVQGSLTVSGRERRLLSDMELALFRIAQEALRNVEKHARARSVEVSVAFGDLETELSVKDDGVGFSLSGPIGDFAASAQLGLLGMQERAQLLGGRLRVHSQPGSGASVTATLPTGTAGLDGRSRSG